MNNNRLVANHERQRACQPLKLEVGNGMVLAVRESDFCLKSSKGGRRVSRWHS
ncbi:hypothetical protein HPP92_028480 [Vanilla planifolia]|uniref:Uncharacterized protein n=1 Tax=Vanilla planifolia TaxID=51239 RepID=A0A835U2L8_VANPL|nr:hypothetical protein HPP92_028480 [Vanilla planifolia]